MTPVENRFIPVIRLRYGNRALRSGTSGGETPIPACSLQNKMTQMYQHPGLFSTSRCPSPCHPSSGMSGAKAPCQAGVRLTFTMPTNHGQQGTHRYLSLCHEFTRQL